METGPLRNRVAQQQTEIEAKSGSNSCKIGAFIEILQSAMCNKWLIIGIDHMVLRMMEKFFASNE
jgi:hypothetical protein